MAETDRITNLERKLEQAQKQISDIQAELAEIKRDPAATKSAVKLTQAPKPKPPAAPKVRSREWEFFFGGNILGKAGVLSMVIALSWFIKYAFDNNWVNESGKIFFGSLISATLGFFGLWTAKKKFQALPLALFGGSIAGFLMTIFAAYYLYDLFGRTEAFLYLAGVLLSGFLLSYRTASQSLFVFSLLGAFGLPVMFSQGENSYRFLFSYLLLVNLGYHAINRKFRWRISSAVMAVLNITVWMGWYAANGQHSSFLIPFSYLSVVSIAYLFAENPFRNPRSGDFALLTALLFMVFFFFYGGTGYQILMFHHADYAPHFLAFASLLPVWQFRNIAKQPEATPGILLFICSKAGATLALLAFFKGNDLTLALLAAIAFYLHLFAARRFTLSYITSLPLVLVFVARLFTLNFDRDAWPFLNYRFMLFALSAALFAYTHLRARDFGKQWYWKIPGGFALTMLIIGTCVQVDLVVSNAHYRNLGYSYVLAFYAAVFLGAGFWKQGRFLRQSGFILALLLVAKLYLYDIWTLSLLPRIIAGLSLGAGLVVLSLMYQKFREQLMKSFGKTPVALFLIGAVALGGGLRAESIKGYHFVKKIQPATGAAAKSNRLFGWLRIDDEIYRNSGDYDIRLRYKNRSLPYLVRGELTAQKSELTKQPTVTYSDATENVQTYVLRMPQLPEGYVYDVLTLQRYDTFESNVIISATDFDGSVSSAGEQRLFRHRDEENLKIRLAARGVKSLRLEISPPGQFEVVSATARAATKDTEIPVAVDLASLKMELNKDIRYSVVYFNNPDGRKLSRVRIKFKESRYRREVKVYEQTAESRRYALTDSRVVTRGKSEKEVSPWVEFTFNGNRARKLKLEIAYADDAPLTVDGFETWALSENILFEIPAELEANEDILLYYGNRYARQPSYDLASRIDANSPLTQFSAAKGEANPDFGYALVEPPLSTWVIRITFGILLAALVLAAWKILGKYAETNKPAES